MAKFAYKLQPLLNVKIQMEDNLKNELGKAIQKHEDEMRILRLIESEREEHINEIYSKSSNGIRAGKLQEYSSYITHLKQRIDLQKEKVNYARMDVDKYREQLIIISQEKEMLEKLKEKKYKGYLKEQLKGEQRLNDELNSFKYSGNMAGDGNGKR